MIVQRFLAWAPTAPAAERAEGAGALARAYLYSGLDASDRRAAEGALTLLLDDPCVDVRRNMAEALAPSFFVPAHIVVALAYDTPEVAIPVLMLSPVLTEADLIDILPIRGSEEQAAVAARNSLSPAVAAALAEVGTAVACAVLARNPHAEFTPRVFARLTERHGVDAAVRDALLERDDLPISERQKLMLLLAERLGSTAVSRFRLGEERVRRMTEDACQTATLAIAGDHPSAMMPLVSHLRETGQLTTALVLRALASGDMDFVEAAFAELTGLERSRVRRLLQDPVRTGFRALYRDAGFPPAVFAAFSEAFEAWAELRDCGEEQLGARREVAERLYETTSGADALSGAAGLLRRLAAAAGRRAALGGLKIRAA